MTGRDAITAALRLIGAVAPGESLAASEATDGLSSLNRMLSSWSVEGLLLHAITVESPLTLTPSDGTVTLGTSGDITTRPVKIEKAWIRDASTNVDMPPMRLLSADEYAAIPDKTAESDYPSSLWDDGGYTQRTLRLHPVPSAAHKLCLLTWRALTSISTLDTSISLPDGYEDALIYNMAMRLSPEYGRPVSAEIALMAGETKAAIARANHRPNYLRCDDALTGGGRYNIYTGGY